MHNEMCCGQLIGRQLDQLQTERNNAPGANVVVVVSRGKNVNVFSDTDLSRGAGSKKMHH